MYTRHTTLVTGPTCAGKTTIQETLRQAKTLDGIKTTIVRINPKDRPILELYGDSNPDTGDWIDGLLSKIFRKLNDNRVKIKDEEKWIIFDGDMDATWIENMNSVMDDSKELTLAADRIKLLPTTKLILESFDLSYSSPATISRTGVLYMDNSLMGYKPYYYRWCKMYKPDGVNEDKRPEKMREILEEYSEHILEPLIK